MNLIQTYWNTFLEHYHPSKTNYYSAFSFGSSDESAKELLNLVLKGKKTATCSSLEAFQLEQEAIPQQGDYSIVLNEAGIPACIIETTDVLVMEFKDMTYEICKREGEDLNLESWQKNHIDFFISEGNRLGYFFSWDMKIVFEDFKVVYR